MLKDAKFAYLFEVNVERMIFYMFLLGYSFAILQIVTFRCWFLLTELMLLGFISLLLTVFQNAISKICVSSDVLTGMLPCKREDNKETGEGSNHTTSHFQKYFALTLSGGTRHLLAETTSTGYCGKKVTYLSITKSMDVTVIYAIRKNKELVYLFFIVRKESAMRVTNRVLCILFKDTSAGFG